LDRRFLDISRSALAASVLLPPRLPPALWPAAIGVAAAEGLRALGVVDVWLKWPNDLICPSGKLGGVLIETRGELVVAGLGINLLGAPPGVGAVALAEVWPRARGVGFAELRATVLGAYLAVLTTVLEEEPDALRERYRRVLGTLGQHVRVELPEGEVIGLAQEVDAQGRLLVADGVGVRAVSIGDVVHLRPIEERGQAPRPEEAP